VTKPKDLPDLSRFPVAETRWQKWRDPQTGNLWLWVEGAWRLMPPGTVLPPPHPAYAAPDLAGRVKAVEDDGSGWRWTGTRWRMTDPPGTFSPDPPLPAPEEEGPARRLQPPEDGTT
jgi:hypothetical protein